MLKNGGSTIKGLKRLDSVSKSILRKFLTLNDIQKLSFALRTILHKLVLPSLALLSSYNWHYIRCVLFLFWHFLLFIISLLERKKENTNPCSSLMNNCLLLENHLPIILDCSFFKFQMLLKIPYAQWSWSSKRFLFVCVGIL